MNENKPDTILVAANCRKAQTLRKELRAADLFKETVFCGYGETEVSSLMAKKRKIRSENEEQVVLQAISMARMKQNPMAEILSLWSDNISENGVLSMNLHPLQKAVDQVKLKESL